jgi:hypothetical protein
MQRQMDGRVQTNWEREMNYQVLKVCDDVLTWDVDGTGQAGIPNIVEVLL